LGREEVSSTFSPERWAIELTKLLNQVLGPEHFPINVVTLAREYSAQRFPDDPITLTEGAALSGFDGALYRAPAGKKGWGIIYNNSMMSAGRINFTLAHEFGHYLLHRAQLPKGIQCNEQDTVRWDPEYGQRENEANRFAASLLMPLDDFRKQIAPTKKVDIEDISRCADRYKVSLIAATLRWLEFTLRRAILVVSRDGFILWARSSKPALKTGLFFRTSSGPIEIHSASLAARQNELVDGRGTFQHEPGVWLSESALEMTVVAERYDFVVTVLQFPNHDGYVYSEESDEDSYDRISTRTR